MKSIVIYNSQTGFTKKYAEWISEDIGCECVELSHVRKSDLLSYDTVVFGSWCCAGSISKLAWFKKHVMPLSASGKKLIVYAVGGSPEDNPDISVMLKKSFTEEERSVVKIFYCPGGFDYEKMQLSSKLMMKMFLKVLCSKKDRTEKDEIMIKMISQSYDISDRKYVKEIEELLK